MSTDKELVVFTVPGMTVGLVSVTLGNGDSLFIECRCCGESIEARISPTEHLHVSLVSLEHTNRCPVLKAAGAVDRGDREACRHWVRRGRKLAARRESARNN